MSRLPIADYAVLLSALATPDRRREDERVSNVALVTEAVDGYRRGDLAAALASFAPDVQWRARAPGVPGCCGLGAVRAMLDVASRTGVDGAVTIHPVGGPVVVGFE